ncbi:NUMOD4 domain-containing protein [Actinomadura sp. 3N407]|uniref:NUMOD4 domain-containing protein n=1 Tax=Actinomadura sp. 3N407 TaxID=3457423 RepID=UPI003FCE11B2
MDNSRSHSAAEQWRPCPGYEGVYEVSDAGRVRRAAPGRCTWPGRILRPSIGTSGYPKVGLYAAGKVRSHHVHRLVAAAFLSPPPSPEHEVHHRNADTRDASLANLVWLTRQQNAALRRPRLPRRPQPPTRVGPIALTRDQVAEIRARHAAGGISYRALAREYGVAHGTIRAACLRTEGAWAA